MLSPVIIFVYNRPKHIKETIEALEKNILAKETDVFIFSDGYKNEKDMENVMKTREYIKSLEASNYFKTLRITFSDKNKGLAKSVIGGVDEIINKYNKVIVLEDDLITTKNFLGYINDSLEFYENKKNIWSTTGVALPIYIPKDYESDIYLSYRGCSCGWGTWKDRWNSIDWKVEDYKKFKDNLFQRKKFNRGGNDLALMLDLQMQGKIDSWAIRWCYSQFKQDRKTVYPIKSYIKNIGMDGSGTHKANTNKFSTDLIDENYKWSFKDIDIDKKIIKSFKKLYGKKYIYIYSYIKNRLGLVYKNLEGKKYD